MAEVLFQLPLLWWKHPIHYRNCQLILWLVEEVPNLWLGKSNRLLIPNSFIYNVSTNQIQDRTWKYYLNPNIHNSVLYIQVTEVFCIKWHLTKGPQDAMGSKKSLCKTATGHNHSSGGQKLFPVHTFSGLRIYDVWEQRRSIFLAETSTAGISGHI